jgi:glycosyltransferase involved in cell wall biosynthesis
MRKAVHIITGKVFDRYQNQFTIGGLQTYVFELSKFLSKYYRVILHEKTDNNFTQKYEGVIIIGNSNFRTFQNLFDSIYNKSDIFIVATDQLPIKSKESNVIVIQHGIAFDFSREERDEWWSKSSFLTHINKFSRCIRNIKRFHYIQNTVCVDYNYFNWLRTLSWIESPKKLLCIPNFASYVKEEKEINSKLAKNRQRISILFARRFVKYRGALLFANIVERLLIETDNIDFTFAGSGPLENFLNDKFRNNDRVTITSFNSIDSVDFHYHYDIAIVPTISSEGTSLSLIEAMAAGCFPICTYVGGMSNMIIDNFNGRIVYPDEKSIYEGIVDVVNMKKEEFNRVVRDSYNTAKNGFSKENWGNKWLKFIEEII